MLWLHARYGCSALHEANENAQPVPQLFQLANEWFVLMLVVVLVLEWLCVTTPGFYAKPHLRR